MAFARTITGDVDPSTLGAVNAHEHLIRRGGGEIRHDGEALVATKIVGDDCVPAGFESFSGRLPHSSPTGAIVWTCGTPRAPASEQRPGYLRVLSHDMFRAGDAFGDFVFHRQS